MCTLSYVFMCPVIVVVVIRELIILNIYRGMGVVAKVLLSRTSLFLVEGRNSRVSPKIIVVLAKWKLFYFYVYLIKLFKFTCSQRLNNITVGIRNT